jgi:hypothetical protein
MNQKSPYKKGLNIRISEEARQWLKKVVPASFPSFSHYVDLLIKKDKERAGK